LPPAVRGSAATSADQLAARRLRASIRGEHLAIDVDVSSVAVDARSRCAAWHGAACCALFVAGRELSTAARLGLTPAAAGSSIAVFEFASLGRGAPTVLRRLPGAAGILSTALLALSVALLGQSRSCDAVARPAALIHLAAVRRIALFARSGIAGATPAAELVRSLRGAIGQSAAHPKRITVDAVGHLDPAEPQRVRIRWRRLVDSVESSVVECRNRAGALAVSTIRGLAANRPRNPQEERGYVKFGVLAPIDALDAETRKGHPRLNVQPLLTDCLDHVIVVDTDPKVPRRRRPAHDPSRAPLPGARAFEARLHEDPRAARIPAARLEALGSFDLASFESRAGALADTARLRAAQRTARVAAMTQGTVDARRRPTFAPVTRGALRRSAAALTRSAAGRRARCRGQTGHVSL